MERKYCGKAVVARADLLVRRCDTGFEDGNYGPVGGHLDGGESIRQAAIRECREEIGVEIDPGGLEIIGVTHYCSPEGEGVDFFLSATRWAGEPYPRSECDDLQWCSLDVLPENTIPFVRRAIGRHLQAGIWFDEVYLDVDWPPAHPLEKGDCDADCDR
ncbi:MAG: NUDIX domain-containing protein [Anaerolineae bacterium]|jgi:8-oxo-dGTP diphosphatase